MKKFWLLCLRCGASSFGMSKWFAAGQTCPACGHAQADVQYADLPARLARTFSRPKNPNQGMWHYFDVLPLRSERNVVSAGEGNVSIDRWRFLEAFAREHFGVRCRVYAHRQDNNNATGSFKDLSGSLVASVSAENGIDTYAVASTGNIGVSFARYISRVEGTLYVFIPRNSPKFKEAEIAIFGQKVFRVKGDYERAKGVMREFAARRGITPSGETTDPLRVEAKKTMAFEWFRMDVFPSVYIQALSGGTGAIGVAKGCREMMEASLIRRPPRQILVQSSACAPMADAWRQAKRRGFPEGWEKDYPVYKDVKTEIPTLATGRPTCYPIVSALVRSSGGEILSVPESMASEIACLVAYETAVRVGPAAAVAVGGFFAALKHGALSSGDRVMINIGEGIRRDPEFMNKIIAKSTSVSSAGECRTFRYVDRRKAIWRPIERRFLGQSILPSRRRTA